jgi:ADP-heptose:LPS heptosyltransferase
MLSKIKIPVLRRVDRIVGLSIIGSQNFLRKKSTLPSSPKKILIIKLFGFGNFIFLSPTFKAIKKMFPEAELHVLTYNQNREICQMYSNLVDQVHTLEYATAKMAYSITSFSSKHHGEYDIVIDFEQFVRLSAIIGRMLGPKYLIGIATENSGKAKAFDAFIEYKEDTHVVEEYYAVAKYIAAHYKKKIEEKPILIAPSYDGHNISGKVLQGKSRMSLVGVCPGGRADDVERKYPKDRLAEALETLVDKKKNVHLVFFGTRSEKPDIDYIKSKIKDPSRYTDASGTKLQETSELISKMKIFISNDTGPIHLAASLGVFCVGLYGPSKEWVYGPYTKKKIIVRDEKHSPVRSNHNEKDKRWSRQWWPTSQELYSKLIKLV